MHVIHQEICELGTFETFTPDSMGHFAGHDD